MPNTVVLQRLLDLSKLNLIVGSPAKRDLKTNNMVTTTTMWISAHNDKLATNPRKQITTIIRLEHEKIAQK